ncbi:MULTISPECIES: O-antigen ligase [unclassified Adlercreutzia]|uniref:O-antigen ligase family protein n=1 Tax=unclassified Adlercreutzia TaxID=2636013 RepID=UPI0013E9D19E|nr:MULTISPECIES: O-antigen ligase family protein [unclassified Adlercreutzia]
MGKIARNEEKTLYLSAIPGALTLGLVYLFDNMVFVALGYACLIACVLMVYGYLIRTGKKLDSILLFLVIGTCLWNLFELAKDPSGLAIRTFAVEIVAYLFLLGMVAVGYESVIVRSFRKWLLALCLLLSPFVLAIVVAGGGDAHIRMFESVFSMTIYKTLLAVFCVLLLECERRFVLCASFVVLFILIGDRASAICCAAGLLAYWGYGFLIRRRLVCWGVFCSIIFFSIAVPLVYVSLYGTVLGYEINQFSRDYFGSNFFSGRNIIWDQVFSAISENPVLGNGLNSRVSVGVINGTDGVGLSFHNTYLTILFQGGIVGFALFVGILARLWSLVFSDGKESKVKRVAFCSLIMLLVLGCFEVTMIQNTVNVALMLWLFVAMGNTASEASVLMRDKQGAL